MATINNVNTVIALIRNNGVYLDDPQLYALYEYQNTIFNKTCYSLCYTPSDEEALINAGWPHTLLWSRAEGATVNGRIVASSMAHALTEEESAALPPIRGEAASDSDTEDDGAETSE